MNTLYFYTHFKEVITSISIIIELIVGITDSKSITLYVELPK